MIETTRKANTYSSIRTIEISAKIRAKCGKCWGALKNATVPTTGRQATNAGLPMSGYVRGRTTSLPTRKCLHRRRRRSVREEIAERAVRERFFFFFSVFLVTFFLAPLFFPPRSFGSLRSRWSDFSSRSSKPKPRYSLSPFVPHAKALITLFRVGRRSRSY